MERLPVGEPERFMPDLFFVFTVRGGSDIEHRSNSSDRADLLERRMGTARVVSCVACDGGENAGLAMGRPVLGSRSSMGVSNGARGASGIVLPPVSVSLLGGDP